MKNILLFLCLIAFYNHKTTAQPCYNGVTPCSVGFGQSNGSTVQTPNGTPVFTFTSQPLAPCEVATGNQEFNSVNGVTSLKNKYTSYILIFSDTNYLPRP